MIYIVRHGQTDWNVEGRYAGRQDVELNNTGIEQANTIKESLKDVEFDVVISSPLKRALKTANIILGDNLSLHINTDERIIERSNGELEGKLKTETDQNIDFNAENIKYGIEPIKVFRKRINDFCKDITEKYRGKNVLVVTHAGVGIYIRCFFEGEPEGGNFQNYKMKNCEVLEYNND